MTSFRKALTLADCSIWALIHTVNLMMSQKMFRDAMALVQKHSAHFRAHELFEGFVDDVAATIYRSVSDTMFHMISDSLQDAALDTFADGRLAEVAAFINTVKIGGRNLKLPATQPARVSILACLDLPQCTFYRVEQKRRLLQNQGYTVEVYNLNDPSSFMSTLPGASAAIFYRVPCYPKIIEAILYARSLGIETFFDVDDLIFTRDFPDSFESYESQISREVYFGLCHGVALYRQAIRLCAGALVSTRPLAEAIAPLVSGGSVRTFVVPNGLDDRAERATRSAHSRGAPGESLSIFYGSGTKAHNSDFSDIVAPALLSVLENYTYVRIVIVGHLHIDRRFDNYAERISRFSFITDIDTYWAILASCDINISVLHPGPIADGKSEIKWLEAAMLAIPSIVSATRTYGNVLRDGETGLIAHDVGDWQRHLRSLIDDDEQRQRIGLAARAVAVREYSPSAVTTKLEAALFCQDASARGDPETIRKKRILVCNVFFAPQSYGGATRIFEDNITELLDRYDDEFELSILSTYVGLKPGTLRVESHRGCPVYRIGSPAQVNMDWRPYNDEMLPAFRRVLDIAQPDLVHFHCVQRLTASVVEETLRSNIPYIVTVHDAWWISDHQFLVDQDDRVVDIDDPFGTPLPAGIGRPESLLRLQRLKSLLNFGVATLAVSDSFADLYRRAGATNVRTCENGLSQLRHPITKDTPKDKVVLGHIGGRSVHKGAALVEAVLKMHKFCNLELLMVDNTLEVGDEEAFLWGATPVTLRARVDRANVGELYHKIDVLLAPSIWPESYGLVVREAQHFRTWVVVSDRGALAQDIVEGENGFVIDPAKTDGLACVLKRIDDDIGRIKVSPKETQLRSSAQQLDDVVAIYREILNASESTSATRSNLE